MHLVEVEWDEINTALGQTAYLMAIIAHRFGYKFPNSKINLCGAMTTMQSINNGNDSPKHNLFLSGQSGGENDKSFNLAQEVLFNSLDGLTKYVKDKMSEITK